jgi:hypothetical protein
VVFEASLTDTSGNNNIKNTALEKTGEFQETGICLFFLD